MLRALERRLIRLERGRPGLLVTLPILRLVVEPSDAGSELVGATWVEGGTRHHIDRDANESPDAFTARVEEVLKRCTRPIRY